MVPHFKAYLEANGNSASTILHIQVKSYIIYAEWNSSSIFHSQIVHTFLKCISDNKKEEDIKSFFYRNGKQNGEVSYVTEQ